MTACYKDGIATLGCIPFLFGYLITAAFFFAGTTAVYFIVIAGIKFITSQGDKVKVAQARATMTFAIIGLVIIVFSFFIMRLIQNSTGVACTTLGVGC